MTKISKKGAYPVKLPVRKDYFAGTDSENNLKTVNFEFESTAKLINEINGMPILNYMFKTDPNIPLEVLTEGVFLSEGNETTVADITKLYINKKNFHETDMTELFQFIAINKEAFVLKLRNSSNLNNAVYFTITDATEFESYFTLDIAINITNAAVPELIHFNVYFFDFELKATVAGTSDPLKLDKAGYSGNAADLDERINALESQTPGDYVNADWNETNPASKKFIENKPDFSAIGVFSKRYAGSGQTYTLPVGAIAFTAFIDGYVQYPLDETFPLDLNVFEQSGVDVTFKTTIETYSQILINYYL